MKGRVFPSKITTVSGYILATSLQYPVFAGWGLLPLGSLKNGDYLISTAACDFGSPGDPNEDYKPAKISELFGALSLTRAIERIPARCIDFYGDRRDSYVDIICVDCLLRVGGDPSSREEPGELALTAPSASFCALAGDRALPEHFVGEPETTRSPKLDATSSESTSYRIFRDAKAGSNLSTPKTGTIGFDKVCNVEFYPLHDYLYNLETSVDNHTANRI